ncbi:MAG: hypothetical protein H6638_09005 [Ardenticatenales bacterium]|nr:hypothetical protein [Ardenticatenales bacterium]MCB9172043.1 hypothetical protein [Ardenticatenales bacterium]
MNEFPDPILQPVDIVYGVYHLTGPWRGDDRWWIQRLVESETGWMVHNDIYLDQPAPRYLTLDVELSESWAWRYLNLRDDQGQMLSAEVVDGSLVVERAGEVAQLPFGPASELSFFSPFMTSLTLRRQRLAVGDRYDCRAVEFDAETFAPRCLALAFERGEDLVVTLKGQRQTLQQIHRYNIDTGAAATWLARDDGLVIHTDEAALSLAADASRGRGRMPRMGHGGREV